MENMLMKQLFRNGGVVKDTYKGNINNESAFGIITATKNQTQQTVINRAGLGLFFS